MATSSDGNIHMMRSECSFSCILRAYAFTGRKGNQRMGERPIRMENSSADDS